MRARLTDTLVYNKRICFSIVVNSAFFLDIMKQLLEDKYKVTKATNQWGLLHQAQAVAR